GRAGTGSAGLARRVVRVAGRPAPRAPRAGAVAAGGRARRAARIAAAGVVLVEVRLGVDDGALRAQFGHDGRILRRGVHRVVDVGATGRAHITRVVHILEREGD